jgi:glucosamine--fructose-6-phosphate aminotransferase (isomerizing)
MAQEAALKLKETSRVHAESFSAAEIMHGPLELIGTAFPVFAFCPADAAEETTVQAIGRMRGAGATVIAAGRGVGDISLPYARTAHPLLDPISMIQTFYGLAERVSRLRGHHPDRPRLLRKETATL